MACISADASTSAVARTVTSLSVPGAALGPRRSIARNGIIKTIGTQPRTHRTPPATVQPHASEPGVLASVMDDGAVEGGGVGALTVPDLLTWPDGTRVRDAVAWHGRGAAWRSLIVDRLYGGLPPAPECVRVVRRSVSSVRALAGAPSLEVHRVVAEGGEVPVRLSLRLLLPPTDGPVPVIVHGDGCWWPPSERTVRLLQDRGVALARFDRTEVADDPAAAREPGPAASRSGPLYDAYPGATFGALAAWAWAFQRAVDALAGMRAIDADRIAVTGFSRGAKAALLAAAVDERVAFAHDHASGAGGAALSRVVGPGGESLHAVVAAFPAWFGPAAPYLARDPDRLPFDQHALLASVAPRRLLLTYGAADAWANPLGARLAVEHAASVYRLLGAEAALEFRTLAGGHEHGDDAWATLVEAFVGPVTA